MHTMTGKERLLTALRRETPDCVPTFEWFIDSGVTKALTGTDDPLLVADALDLDGVNVRADYRKNFIDAETFVDEWGIKRRLTGDCIPCVTESPITDITRHAEYVFPDPLAPHRLATLEKSLKHTAGRRAVICNLRDGFSDMRDLLGYEEALVQLMLEPEHFAALLDRCVEYNLALASIAVKKHGIQIIATTDDIANAGGLLISPKVYAEVIGPAFRKVIQGYRNLGCHVIKHCDGNVQPLLDFWIECGITCLDPIDPAGGMHMPTIKKKYGDRICLKGNIDCAGVLQDGTPADVETAVRECLDGCGRSGIILSSSNSIHRGVKPENYRAMLQALRREGTTKAGQRPAVHAAAAV
ncbi:MAG TPA: uroporphyrinogen decarboxylase family protein [Planctomycetota bacterium]